MPHIHTKPDHHDVTVSAYILRWEDDEWKCLVHFHRKLDKLMQIGGHLELNETPWQSIYHELKEESGYELDQLDVLQHSPDILSTDSNVTHPTPFCMNTHNVGNEHYHSDITFGFVASEEPIGATSEGESSDLRWLSISELEQEAGNNNAIKDVPQIYAYLLNHLESYYRIPATSYSLEKPQNSGVTYKRGAPGE